MTRCFHITATRADRPVAEFDTQGKGFDDAARTGQARMRREFRGVEYDELSVKEIEPIQTRRGKQK